jgi:hypothetical protein
VVYGELPTEVGVTMPTRQNRFEATLKGLTWGAVLSLPLCFLAGKGMWLFFLLFPVLVLFCGIYSWSNARTKS